MSNTTHNAEVGTAQVSRNFVPKVYGNRFATQELQPDGTWIVINEVTGLPISSKTGEYEERIPKVFKTYRDARSEVVYLYQHYRSLEG